MPSHALALHTSSSQLGLAVCEVAMTSPSLTISEATGRQQTWDLGRRLLNDFHGILQDWIQPLTWRDFAYLAVAQGPGSFTSTRIGMVTARTLGQQLALPVFTVSSLAAFAHHSLTIPNSLNVPTTAIAVELAASRGQVYGGLYQVQSAQLVALQPDALYETDDWLACLNQQPGEILRYTAPEPLGDTVGSVLALAHQAWQRGERPDWSMALPFYGNEKL